MLKNILKAIHKLRVIVLLGISLVFLIQLQMNPLEVGRYIGANFSDAVGMKTTIVENPDNRLARQLKEKETELNEKESILNNREVELEQKIGQNLGKYFWIIFSGIILLMVLIIINFILDFKRRKNNDKEN